jgi:hypothetical protein
MVIVLMLAVPLVAVLLISRSGSSPASDGPRTSLAPATGEASYQDMIVYMLAPVPGTPTTADQIRTTAGLIQARARRRQVAARVFAEGSFVEFDLSGSRGLARDAMAPLRTVDVPGEASLPVKLQIVSQRRWTRVLPAPPAAAPFCPTPLAGTVLIIAKVSPAIDVAASVRELSGSHAEVYVDADQAAAGREVLLRLPDVTGSDLSSGGDTFAVRVASVVHGLGASPTSVSQSEFRSAC